MMPNFIVFHLTVQNKFLEEQTDFSQCGF